MEGVDDSVAWSGPNAKNYITTATTTQVTTAGEGNWILEGLLIQQQTAGTVKVYDDDDGTSGIFIDLPIGTVAGPWPCSVICSTGIRVVTSDAERVLVVYRKI